MGFHLLVEPCPEESDSIARVRMGMRVPPVLRKGEGCGFWRDMNWTKSGDTAISVTHLWGFYPNLLNHDKSG